MEDALRDAVTDAIKEQFDRFGMSPTHVLVDAITDRVIDICRDVFSLLPDTQRLPPPPVGRPAMTDAHFRQGTSDA